MSNLKISHRYYLRGICMFLAATLLTSCSQDTSPTYTITGHKQESPNILVFGIHPYKNPRAMLEAYYPLITYLNTHLKDSEVQLEMSKNYADYEDKLRQKRFHITLPNPYQALEAIENGYKVIAKMSPDDDFRGIIIARKDSNIKSIKDLKGKVVSFPSATALAAAMMPKMTLYDKGINPNRDITPKYVGSQESSILNAYYGDTSAGVTWPVPWRTWSKKNPDKANEMQVLLKTHTLPNCPIIIRDDVSQDIVKQLIDALLKLSSDEDFKTHLEQLEIKGFVRANNETYNVVKKFVQRHNHILGAVK